MINIYLFLQKIDNNIFLTPIISKTFSKYLHQRYITLTSSHEFDIIKVKIKEFKL